MLIFLIFHIIFFSKFIPYLHYKFVTLLGQSPLNKRDLSELYGLSSTEEKYIASGKSGMGLICINNGDIIVPMNDDFPKDTELYRIMTSKPDERMMA